MLPLNMLFLQFKRKGFQNRPTQFSNEKTILVTIKQ